MSSAVTRPTARAPTGRWRRRATARCSREDRHERAGRPPSAASARKNGKTTRPKRGRDSSGQRSLGTLSGSARLSAAKSPYGAPKRRQATTVRGTNSARKASPCDVYGDAAGRLDGASCGASGPRRAADPAQPTLIPSQMPPSGPAGDRWRCQRSCARGTPRGRRAAPRARAGKRAQSSGAGARPSERAPPVRRCARRAAQARESAPARPGGSAARGPRPPRGQEAAALGQQERAEREGEEE